MCSGPAAFSQSGPACWSGAGLGRNVQLGVSSSNGRGVGRQTGEHTSTGVVQAVSYDELLLSVATPTILLLVSLVIITPGHRQIYSFGEDRWLLL
jgi:hypothetical protein